jgi:hypothetical protein
MGWCSTSRNRSSSAKVGKLLCAPWPASLGRGCKPERSSRRGRGARRGAALGGLTEDRSLLVAHALARSAALAQDEAQVAAVFDIGEPWARQLAKGRREPAGRREMIQLIGSALIVQHRLAERVAVREKPDMLWDRPDLERLYARLAVEYELIERSETLVRKLDLIGET